MKAEEILKGVRLRTEAIEHLIIAYFQFIHAHELKDISLLFLIKYFSAFIRHVTI